MNKSNDLEVPSAVLLDPDSFEILRVWVANKQQQIVLRGGVWEDPAAWGILLADVARQIANTYRVESGRDVLKTLNRIKAGFDVELG